MRTTPFRRTLAAAASGAVAVAGLAAFAPAANAASDSIPFDCEVPVLGERSFSLVAETDLPDQVEAGKAVTVTFTATVTAPDNVRGGATLFGSSVEGTADVAAKVGSKDFPVKATVPLTTIPTTPATELVLPVSGKAKWTPKAVGSQQITLPAFDAELSFPQESGPAKVLPITCVAADGANTLVDTVEVTPATVQATKTKVKAKYKKRAKKVVAKVTVKNQDGTPATGKAKVILKKGKKKAAQANVKLNKKGKAKKVFKKVAKRGKYTLVVKYKGSDVSKKSNKKVKFRVK